MLMVAAYALLALFLAAFLIRVIRLARMPVHLRWELAPIPHEKGRGRYGGSYFEEYEWWKQPRRKSLWSELKYMALEILFLRAVREHNRRLWWFSFPFHLGVYLLSLTAALLVTDALLAAAGVAWSGWSPLVTVLAATGCVLGLAGTAGLLLKRGLDPALRDFTSPEAVLNLVLLGGLFATGLWALSAGAYYAEGGRFVRALAGAESGPDLSVSMATHVLVGLLFLAYLPFSRMMHFVAKYFTYHQVRWDDEPMSSAMEREVTQLLQQKVSWGAPHIGADGRRDWVAVATEEVHQ